MLIEEKIVGAEFTIQAISDGRTVVFPPSTYDYPYRYDGDEGPGTGGMGSLSMAGSTLPFMTAAHYEQACSIIERVIERLAQQGRHFTGDHEQRLLRHRRRRQGDRVQRALRRPRVHEHHEPVRRQLAGGDGAHLRRQPHRGGRSAARGGLGGAVPRLARLRARHGPRRGGPRPAYEFTLERERIEADGCHVFFSSAVEIGEDTYRTVGTSRAVALASTAPTLEQARVRVVECAASVPVLEWRRDVGDERYLQG